MKFIGRFLFCCFALNAFFLRADNTDEIVARIGETGYTSLSAAFSQVKDKETIILTKDIELESAFSISGSKTVTLNFGGNTKVTVNDITANGCQFFADVKTTPSDSKTASSVKQAQANTYINGENVAKVGENFYTSFSSVIDLLNNNNNLEINLVNDIFTPVSSSFSGGIWAAPTLTTTDVQISNGKRVIINALGKEIDSNFSVLGSLILAGGYYTGSLEIPSGEVEGEATSPSGIIYAKRGTKFPENPLEDESLRFKLMGSVAIEQNSDGDYEVVYVPGFSVRIL